MPVELDTGRVRYRPSMAVILVVSSLLFIEMGSKAENRIKLTLNLRSIVCFHICLHICLHTTLP